VRSTTNQILFESSSFSYPTGAYTLSVDPDGALVIRSPTNVTMFRRGGGLTPNVCPTPAPTPKPTPRPTPNPTPQPQPTSTPRPTTPQPTPRPTPQPTTPPPTPQPTTPPPTTPQPTTQSTPSSTTSIQSLVTTLALSHSSDSAVPSSAALNSFAKQTTSLRASLDITSTVITSLQIFNSALSKSAPLSRLVSFYLFIFFVVYVHTIYSF